MNPLNNDPQDALQFNARERLKGLNRARRFTIGLWIAFWITAAVIGLCSLL